VVLGGFWQELVESLEDGPWVQIQAVGLEEIGEILVQPGEQ
jgi:ABC-type phosphate/phosphonate transport system permease subunit